MRDYKILVAESSRFSATAAERLREVGDVTLADLDRPGLLRQVADADVLWIRLRYRIDKEVLAAGSRLRAIVTATTGLNHIDMEEAGRRGIRVISLRGEADFLRTVRATAELTIALLLSLKRHVPRACEHVRAGGWNRDVLWGSELLGKTVGIVGYGRLGRIVGEYLTVFGMRVVAADPAFQTKDMPANVRLLPLPEVLGLADVITLHADLNPASRGFFGREQFAQMKAGALFINTARGELLAEAALLAALHSGRLAGAALDVLCDERPSGMGQHPLVRYACAHENLLITPHIGGCTCESVEKTELFMAGKVVELLSATAHR